MQIYRATEDIPSFQLKKGDELIPSKNNPMEFEHKNGLLLPLPLLTNMVDNGLFEEIIKDTEPITSQQQSSTTRLPNIPKKGLKEEIQFFIDKKSTGANFITNGPLSSYIKEHFINDDKELNPLNENGMYYIGYIKTGNEWDINVYVDPYMNWSAEDTKIVTADEILDLSIYYDLIKKE